MGAANCKTIKKMEEESRLEADMVLVYYQNVQQKRHTVYRSLTARITSAREEIMMTVQKDAGVVPHEKNYDPYYGFLLSQLLFQSCLSHCSTSNNSDETASRNAKQAGKKCISGMFTTQSGRKSPSSAAIKRLARPKTRVKMRPVLGTELKIRLDSPTQAYAKNAPTRLPLSRQSCKKKSPRFVDLTVGKLETEVVLTPRPLDAKKRLSTCVIKNDIKVQFDIISLLPENVQVLIFSFMIDQYSQLLTVSATWYSSLISSYDALFNQIETQLVLKSVDFFLFRNSFTQYIRSKECATTGRINRVIQLELLPGCEMKTLTIGYTYCFSGEPHTRYATQYKIDCKPKRGHRTVWLYKSRNKDSGDVSSHSVNIMPICIGDLFEIAINYYTPRGLIDTESVEWLEPELENTPNFNFHDNSRTRNSLSADQLKEVRTNLNRVCELEQMSTEWYDSKYYGAKATLMDMYSIEKHFDINSIEYAAADPQIRRLSLTARRSGNNDSKIYRSYI